MSGPGIVDARSSAESTTAIVTIVAKNYLAQARVLMDSAKAASPHLLRGVLLVDDVEDYFRPEDEDFLVFHSKDIGIPRSPWFHFKYSVLELSTGVKPFFLSWLIQKYNLSKVIYLDPDIRIYGSLQGIEQALDEANIVLTPHLTHELDDDRSPSELQILRSGTYNLGFIGIRATPETRRFLEWWQARLYDHCVVDLARGFFVDQRWIDLVPGIFGGVHILRDPGYNAAYWNAAHREITWQDGRVFANGRPLVFYHFSGYDPRVPDVLSKHQNRIALADRPDLRVLCDKYREEMFARGFAATVLWPYTHARFRNGSVIPDIGRHLLDEAPHLLDNLEDPFSEEGFSHMVELWNSPVSRSSDGSFGITKLAYRVYRLREDVQAAMPDIFGADYLRFLEWVISSAPREHLFSEPMLRDIRAAIASARTEAPKPIDVGGLPVLCADLLQRGSADPMVARIAGKHRLNSVASINRTAEIGGRPSRLTVLARYIYESRPDLQRVFPDPQDRDAGAYLAWLLNYGHHHYGLTEEFLAPLRANLTELRSTLSLRQKIQLDAYGLMLRAAFALSPIMDKLRRKAGTRTPSESQPVAVPAMPAAARTEASTRLLPPGINIYGYFRAEMGVGQSARNAIEALSAADIEHGIHNLQAAELSQKDAKVQEFSAKPRYRTNLYFVNADQTEVIHASPDRTAGSRNIGFWTWELDEWPAAWDAAYRYYDEIWVPSSFCQVAISARSPVPVIRVPYCVSQLPETSAKCRADFGIDPKKFVYLAVFDMRSCFDRKNPLGVIRAFKAAFANSSACELILKVNHGDADPSKLNLLRREAAGAPIRLIEETFRYDDVAALLRASDCVVSLHRSEGFGLVLGEAMLLGKPVIATAYSGNLDFTTPANSFLVSYKLQEVGFGNAPYPPHCVWAEPDIHNAAEMFTTVYENPSLRQERSAAGRLTIEKDFSPASVGAIMKARLQATGQWM